MNSSNPANDVRELAARYKMKLSRDILKLEANNVPRKLRHLIPHAELWGIGDDVLREDYVSAAPKSALMELVEITEIYNDDFDEWLAGKEAESAPYTNEYISFTNMRMAALSADVILSKG